MDLEKIKKIKSLNELGKVYDAYHLEYSPQKINELIDDGKSAHLLRNVNNKYECALYIKQVIQQNIDKFSHILNCMHKRMELIDKDLELIDVVKSYIDFQLLMTVETIPVLLSEPTINEANETANDEDDDSTIKW